jgi:hypothetical protein
MLLVISLGDWARTWQLICIIPKRIKVNKNIEIGRGIADYFLFPWLDRKHFLTIRNCSVNGHNIAKSTRSLTPPLHQHSGAGATSAAGERLELIQTLPLLDATSETDHLAAGLIAAKAIPETEPRDAFHISIAATNGV